MSDPKPKLGRNILGLSAVSFFTDVSTEMIYPLLPVFLASVLGANASFIGAIEGVAETTASLLKLVSGWWSDKVGSRKRLVVIGYGIASVVRPFTAMAGTARQVLFIRLTDRIGKGIRTSPRDALLADSAPATARGRAFGFHAAADNAGAVVGPLLAFLFLKLQGVGSFESSKRLLPHDEQALRNVFWLSAVPALIAMIVLIIVVRDVPHRDAGEKAAPASVTDIGGGLTKRFWAYLVVILLFTLGNSTDAFLLLRANQLGVPIALAPILWALLNFVKSATGTYGGGLSDRLGRKPLIVGRMAPVLRGLLRVRMGNRRVAGVGSVRGLRDFLWGDRGNREGSRRRHRASHSPRVGIRLVQSRDRAGRPPRVSHLRRNLGPTRRTKRLCVRRHARARGGAAHGIRRSVSYRARRSDLVSGKRITLSSSWSGKVRTSPTAPSPRRKYETHTWRRSSFCCAARGTRCLCRSREPYGRSERASTTRRASLRLPPRMKRGPRCRKSRGWWRWRWTMSPRGST